MMQNKEKKRMDEYTREPSLVILSYYKKLFYNVNIYKKVFYSVKICALKYNALKQKYEFYLIRILV